MSYHEVGHALISALQKNSEPVQKITIVPRTMGALGYVMHVPEEEKYLNTEAELRDMLVSLVGGRAAEEVVFDTVTTGAANDIEKATDIARNMVTRYGMSKKFGLMGLATVESQYLEGRTALNCSDATAAQIDAEVVEILKESYDKALELIRENRGVMDKLAEFLIEKETITGKEFMQIFRREKGLPEPEEAESGGPGQAVGKEGRDGEAAKGQEAAVAPAREKAGESAVPGAEAASEKAEESRRNPGLSESAEGDGEARQPGPAAMAEVPVEELQDAAAQENAGNAAPQPRESASRPEQSAGTGGKETSEQLSSPEASEAQESDARPVGRFSNGRIE